MIYFKRPSLTRRCPKDGGCKTSGEIVKLFVIPSYWSRLKTLARDNRKIQTKAESLVWNVILKKNHLGFGFLRQKPIGKFIIDFYCPKLKLAIEIDGDSHENKEALDLNRDLILSNMGIKTIRYENELVLKKLEFVFEDIKRQIATRQEEINRMA